jgi:Fe-Mn family superoxide dismutase
MLTKHTLPPLPYGYESLEPHIDAHTMQIHHDKHHASYVDNLNTALEKFPQLQERSALWLLLNLNQVPESIRTAVRNNAGGHVNHSLLWKVMTPDGLGAPKGELAKAISRDFGSFDRFKAKFTEAGAKLFGSGWVWLARERDQGGKLVVVTTNGHDNPLMQGLFPLLVNDVWEHAYYLKHQNRRPEYLESWWSVVNWQEAARRFVCAGRGPEHDWEYEDQLALAA